MTNKYFAEKILRVSTRHWAYVLAGKRHLAFNKARKVSNLFETNTELWIDPTASAKARRSAWESFQRRAK